MNPVVMEIYQWLVDVSNGDILSLAQLAVLYYLYREVRLIQQSLMARGAQQIGK